MFLEHISHYEFAKAHLSRNFFTPVVRVFSPRTKGISSFCAASVANGTVSFHRFSVFFLPLLARKAAQAKRQQEAVDNGERPQDRP